MDTAAKVVIALTPKYKVFGYSKVCHTCADHVDGRCQRWHTTIESPNHNWCSDWREAALDMIREQAQHNIPYYGYGDNEAACQMADRLKHIDEQAAAALAAAKEQHG